MASGGQSAASRPPISTGRVFLLPTRSAPQSSQTRIEARVSPPKAGTYPTEADRAEIRQRRLVARADCDTGRRPEAPQVGNPAAPAVITQAGSAPRQHRKDPTARTQPPSGAAGSMKSTVVAMRTPTFRRAAAATRASSSLSVRPCPAGPGVVGETVSSCQSALGRRVVEAGSGPPRKQQFAGFRPRGRTQNIRSCAALRRRCCAAQPGRARVRRRGPND